MLFFLRILAAQVALTYSVPLGTGMSSVGPLAEVFIYIYINNICIYIYIYIINVYINVFIY